MKSAVTQYRFGLKGSGRHSMGTAPSISHLQLESERTLFAELPDPGT